MTIPRGAAVLVLLALAACGDDAPPPAAVSRADHASLDVDAAIAAAVDLRASGCGPQVGLGTGSLIDDGLVATTAHTVAGADRVEIITTESERVAATVVHFDPDLDFALVRTDHPVGRPLPPRSAVASAGEEGVVVLPRLAGEELTMEVAEVTVLRPARINTTDIYLEVDVQREGFEIEGSIDPGDSGAMVVLPGGGVGVVWARSNQRDRRAWAVDLPAVAHDPAARAALVSTVDTGECRNSGN